MTVESHTTSIRPMASAHVRPRSVVVWDPVVRLFHWLLVIAFMANMFVAEEGKQSTAGPVLATQEGVSSCTKCFH
jgi:hypothetical protein